MTPAPISAKSLKTTCESHLSLCAAVWPRWYPEGNKPPLITKPQPSAAVVG